MLKTKLSMKNYIVRFIGHNACWWFFFIFALLIEKFDYQVLSNRAHHWFQIGKNKNWICFTAYDLVWSSVCVRYDSKTVESGEKKVKIMVYFNLIFWKSNCFYRKIFALCTALKYNLIDIHPKEIHIHHIKFYARRRHNQPNLNVMQMKMDSHGYIQWERIFPHVITYKRFERVRVNSRKISRNWNEMTNKSEEENKTMSTDRWTSCKW